MQVIEHHPLLSPKAELWERALDDRSVGEAVRTAQAEGFAKQGDEIVVAAGVPVGQKGSTNALRVAQVK